MTVRSLVAGVGLTAMAVTTAPVTTAATEPPNATVERLQHAVVVLETGRVQVLPPQVFPSPLGTTADSLEGVSHAWVWADATPPQRVGTERFGTPVESPALDWLQVTVPHTGDRRRTRRLIAAPPDMWEEVPEPHLPAFDLAPDATTLDLPVLPGRPTRLRVVAPGWGSWWMDVAAGAAAAVTPVAADDLALEVAGTEAGPLAQARISVLAGHAERGDLRKLADYRTAEDGSIVIPSLPNLDEVVLLVSADGHAPASYQGRPSQLRRRIEIIPGATVSGRFVSEENLPLHGVRVRAVSWVTDELPIPVSRWEVTGPDGRWEFPSLPRRRVEFSSHAAERAPWSRVLDLEGRRLDLGDVTLAAAHALRLTVVDDAGSPVASANLRVDGRPPGALTDDEGMAWVDVVPGSVAEITVAAPRHRSHQVELQPPLPEELRVTLTRAFLVRGRFVDANGVPVPDAEARILRNNRMHDVKLADGGAMELELDPGEPHRVEVRSPRTPVLEMSIEPGLPGEVRELGLLRAPSGLAVTGHLLRADTAAPVAGARVWVPRPTGQGPLVAWMLGDILETWSEADGTFELTGLPAAPATLRIDSAGLARRMVSVVPEPGSQRLDLGYLELGSGVELSVRLIEADEGRDQREASAVVDLGGHNLGADLLRAPVVEGVGRIPNVPPGERTVTVFRSDVFLCATAVTLHADQDSETVECHSRTVPVTGHVEVGGHPAGPGLLVWSAPADDAAVPEAILNFGSGPLRQQHVFSPRRPDVRVAVDDEGRFATSALVSGRWQILWMPYTGATLGPEEVEIPATDAYRTVLRFPALTLSGVVVDTDGRPVENARVRRPGGPALARSGPDGSFVVAGLKPGIHQVQAHTVDRMSRAVQVHLEPDRPAEPVELVLGLKLPELIVTVTTAAGLPAPGALVFVEEGAGDGLRVATADRAGRATMFRSHSRPARVRAAAYQGGTWVLGDWREPGAAADHHLSLVLPEPGTLQVFSGEAEGRPAVTGPGGWDVTALLSWHGTPPNLITSSILVLPGLPPGTYSIALGDNTATAQVDAGETTEVELD